MATYVLVHGAWHHGDLMRPVADNIAANGHIVHTPTIAGNGPGDSSDTGLAAAIDSLVEYIEQRALKDIVLVGHSYGGMVITGAADRLPSGSVRRLVYWNAFVPNDGECLNDLVPDYFRPLFDELSQADGTVMMPFPIWREALTNDMTDAQSQAAYAQLVPQPYRTFTDRISLSKPPAAFEMARSYLNFTDDTGMPADLPWHPRLSSKLGLYRLVQGSGSHEVCFSNPEHAAERVVMAGRD